MISVDIDAAVAAMRKLSKAPDELPTKASLQVSHGVSVGPTAEFRAVLDAAATNLGIRAEKIRTMLADSHEQIAQTLKEFASNDESLTADVALIMEMVSSVDSPAVASGSTTVDRNSETRTAG